MGSFVNNLQIRIDSDADIRDELKRAIDAPAYVSGNLNGWVSVYPNDSIDQCAMARSLSIELARPVLLLVVYDSDVLLYELWHNGELIDEFDSRPDYFVGKPDEEGETIMPFDADRLAKLAGNATGMVKYASIAADAAELQLVLSSARTATFADEPLAELARIMGIDPIRASGSFTYVEAAVESGISEYDAFPMG